MDIRELSYGNYIQNPLGAIGTFRDVREIRTDGGKIALRVKLAYTRSQTDTPPFDSYARLSPEEVLPVRLDEDILQSVGFRKNGSFWDYDNREDTDDVIGFRLGQIANGFVLLCNFRTINVQYLHQLQNLMLQCGIREPLELPLDDCFHFKKTKPMMNRKKTYVTYTHVSGLSGNETRFAVMCENDNQEAEVGMDLNSRTDVKNVRINRSGRGLPKESSKIFFYNEYMQNSKKS